MTDDLKCWMCGGLGAVRLIFPGLGNREGWVPFELEPGEHINPARDDEHVCPACKGSGNPRRTS